jgi:hypothetical protein
MRRYIVLLLITGIVWAQTDFDKLVLKDGTTYLGEYSKIEGKIVYFKPQNAFAFQPISVKQIERLELKDGRVAVLDSKVKSLTLEEYQKLSTKEKAIYDEENNGVFEKFSYPKSLVNEYDRLYYKQVYYKIKRERRGKVVCTTVVITGILVVLLFSNFDLDFGGGGGGGDCGGGGCGQITINP